MDLFAKIKTLAEPLLVAFETDLEHDRRWLEAHPGEAFIHVTRKTGTHLFPLPQADSLVTDEPIPHLFGEARPSEVFRQLREYLNSSLRETGQLWLLFDGKQLRNSTPAKCLEAFDTALRIARGRAERIRRRAS
jgi:hypothetical protein